MDYRDASLQDLTKLHLFSSLWLDIVIIQVHKLGHNFVGHDILSVDMPIHLHLEAWTDQSEEFVQLYLVVPRALCHLEK